MPYLTWWRRLVAPAVAGSGPRELADTVPADAEGTVPTVGTLDNLRSVFWQGFRHLFPPQAVAAQMPNGSIVVSWSILHEPDALLPYAAPVVLRFEEALIEAMSQADAWQRVRMAQQQEATLRAGLRGYDPFARFPNARVVTIG